MESQGMMKRLSIKRVLIVGLGSFILFLPLIIIFIFAPVFVPVVVMGFFNIPTDKNAGISILISTGVIIICVLTAVYYSLKVVGPWGMKKMLEDPVYDNVREQYKKMYGFK